MAGCIGPAVCDNQPQPLPPPSQLLSRHDLMTRLLLSSLVLVLTLTFAGGADWPRFRGPNGSGTAEGPLPEIDPKKPLWKVELPGGKGVGSPIIVDGKVYLQSATAD